MRNSDPGLTILQFVLWLAFSLMAVAIIWGVISFCLSLFALTTGGQF